MQRSLIPALIPALIFAITAIVGVSQSHAQCSRSQGSPGGRTATQFSDSFAQNTFLSPSSNFANVQQRQLQMQRQMLASRDQQLHQVAQQRFARQQQIQATRLANAEAKRAKRAEWIAANLARRSAESESSAVMLASQTFSSSVADDRLGDLK